MADIAQVHFEVRDAIAHITFDHVKARNAMTISMYQSLQSICEEIAKTPSIRVAIFRGAGGKSFVSGSDISQFADFRNGEEGVVYEQNIERYFTPLIMLPIPTIAVIDGMAVGGGLAIASCCDFRISTPDARFGVPIARTLGNCLSPGNIAWLSAHLGIHLVKRMLLLSEMIAAPELLQHGYLLQTHEADRLEEAALELAKRLSSLAPITQKVSKLSLARLIRNSLPNCDDLIKECYGSKDFQNGVKSFIAGEPPVWSGN